MLSTIPLEIVSDVIGSFDDPFEVVERRFLGPNWYERYVKSLPELGRSREVLDWAIEHRDEALILDLLRMNYGDLDHYTKKNDDREDYDDAMSFLKRLVEAKLSQEFGWELTKLPTYMGDLSLHVALETIITVRPRVSNQTFLREIEPLMYFEGIRRTIFFHLLRRHWSDLDEFFRLLEPSLFVKILRGMEKYEASSPMEFSNVLISSL